MIYGGQRALLGTIIVFCSGAVCLAGVQTTPLDAEAKAVSGSFTCSDRETSVGGRLMRWYVETFWNVTFDVRGYDKFTCFVGAEDDSVLGGDISIRVDGKPAYAHSRNSREKQEAVTIDLTNHETLCIRATDAPASSAKVYEPTLWKERTPDVGKSGDTRRHSEDHKRPTEEKTAVPRDRKPTTPSRPESSRDAHVWQVAFIAATLALVAALVYILYLNSRSRRSQIRKLETEIRALTDRLNARTLFEDDVAGEVDSLTRGLRQLREETEILTQQNSSHR